MNLEDTIVAVSSPAGAGERAILRLSGPLALEIAARVFVPAGASALGDRRTYTAVAGRLEPPGSGLSVPASVYLMKGPRSYTRQDVVEFHVGAWPALEGDLVAGLISAGARPAEAGEFTFRAFASGRLDLAQAEAVAAVISAASASALRAAEDLLGGHLSREVAALAQEVRECLALVEADLDFSDQDIEFTPPEQLAARIEAARLTLAALGRRARGIETASGRVRLVLAGRPNAGKSSLFNRLLEAERAIVSPEAGTTRDELRAALHIGGIEFTLSDIAGLDAGEMPSYLAPREYTGGGAAGEGGWHGHAPLRDHVAVTGQTPFDAHGDATARDHATRLGAKYDDDVALKAREKAIEAIGRADLVLLVVDVSVPQVDPLEELMALIAAPVVVAITKCDLAPAGGKEKGAVPFSRFCEKGTVPFSAKKGTAPFSERPEKGAAPFFAEGTAPFFAEVIATSAVTGQGIEELRAALVRAVEGGSVDRQAAGPVLTARHRSALEAAAAALARAGRVARRGGAGELAAASLREALESLAAIVGERAGPDVLDLVFSRFCIGK